MRRFDSMLDGTARPDAQDHWQCFIKLARHFQPQFAAFADPILRTAIHSSTGSNPAESALWQKASDTLREVDRFFYGMQLADREHYVLQRTDVNALIAETLLPILPELKRKHITLHGNFGAEHAFLNLDKPAFQYAFLALVRNAIEAMPLGGRLTVETRSGEPNGPSKSLFVFLLDTGEGISPELREQAFDPFFSTKGRAVGLGLPISQQILENHGGSLALLNNRDVGMAAIFNFSLE